MFSKHEPFGAFSLGVGDFRIDDRTVWETDLNQMIIRFRDGREENTPTEKRYEQPMRPHCGHPIELTESSQYAANELVSTLEFSRGLCHPRR